MKRLQDDPERLARIRALLMTDDQLDAALNPVPLVPVDDDQADPDPLDPEGDSDDDC